MWWVHRGRGTWERIPPPTLAPCPPRSVRLRPGGGRLLRAPGRVHLHAGLPEAVRHPLLQLRPVHRGRGGVGAGQDLPPRLLRVRRLPVSEAARPPPCSPHGSRLQRKAGPGQGTAGGPSGARPLPAQTPQSPRLAVTRDLPSFLGTHRPAVRRLLPHSPSSPPRPRPLLSLFSSAAHFISRVGTRFSPSYPLLPLLGGPGMSLTHPASHSLGI